MEATTDYQMGQTWGQTLKRKEESRVILRPAASQENVTALSATFLPNLN